MSDFREELQSVLERWPRLKGARIELEATESGRVGGVIVSTSFTGQRQLKRQDTVWRYLRKELTEEQQRAVIM